MRTLLFGRDAGTLRALVKSHDELMLVDHDPEAVICFGGDGTLLAAELKWPGVPKVPIRNSRRGHRCMPHPAKEIIARFAAGDLVRTEYDKLECALYAGAEAEEVCYLTAMNEFNVHMGHINSSVRYRIWIDDEPYATTAVTKSDHEIIGDGFVISTPFGSTAYFNQITRGVFRTGLGVAFKYTSEQVNHIIVPATSVFRVQITRGPAVLAFDNSHDYFELEQDDELVVRRYAHPAIVMTWDPMTYPSDRF